MLTGVYFILTTCLEDAYHVHACRMLTTCIYSHALAVHACATSDIIFCKPKQVIVARMIVVFSTDLVNYSSHGITHMEFHTLR